MNAERGVETPTDDFTTVDSSTFHIEWFYFIFLFGSVSEMIEESFKPFPRVEMRGAAGVARTRNYLKFAATLDLRWFRSRAFELLQDQNWSESESIANALSPTGSRHPWDGKTWDGERENDWVNWMDHRD